MPKEAIFNPQLVQIWRKYFYSKDPLQNPNSLTNPIIISTEKMKNENILNIKKFDNYQIHISVFKLNTILSPECMNFLRDKISSIQSSSGNSVQNYCFRVIITVCYQIIQMFYVDQNEFQNSQTNKQEISTDPDYIKDLLKTFYCIVKNFFQVNLDTLNDLCIIIQPVVSILRFHMESDNYKLENETLYIHILELCKKVLESPHINNDEFKTECVKYYVHSLYMLNNIFVENSDGLRDRQVAEDTAQGIPQEIPQDINVLILKNDDILNHLIVQSQILAQKYINVLKKNSYLCKLYFEYSCNFIRVFEAKEDSFNPPELLDYFAGILALWNYIKDIPSETYLSQEIPCDEIISIIKLSCHLTKPDYVFTDELYEPHFNYLDFDISDEVFSSSSSCDIKFDSKIYTNTFNDSDFNITDQINKYSTFMTDIQIPSENQEFITVLSLTFPFVTRTNLPSFANFFLSCLKTMQECNDYTLTLRFSRAFCDILSEIEIEKLDHKIDIPWDDIFNNLIFTERVSDVFYDLYKTQETGEDSSSDQKRIEQLRIEFLYIIYLRKQFCDLLYRLVFHNQKIQSHSSPNSKKGSRNDTPVDNNNDVETALEMIYKFGDMNGNRTLEIVPLIHKFINSKEYNGIVNNSNFVKLILRITEYIDNLRMADVHLSTKILDDDTNPHKEEKQKLHFIENARLSFLSVIMALLSIQPQFSSWEQFFAIFRDLFFEENTREFAVTYIDKFLNSSNTGFVHFYSQFLMNLFSLIQNNERDDLIPLAEYSLKILNSKGTSVIEITSNEMFTNIQELQSLIKYLVKEHKTYSNSNNYS